MEGEKHQPYHFTSQLHCNLFVYFLTCHLYTFFVMLLLLLGISVYYTVIDYQPLPPLFFPLSHIQEVKAPAPLAMARE